MNQDKAEEQQPKETEEPKNNDNKKIEVKLPQFAENLLERIKAFFNRTILEEKDRLLAVNKLYLWSLIPLGLLMLLLQSVVYVILWVISLLAANLIVSYIIENQKKKPTQEIQTEKLQDTEKEQT